MTVKKKQDKNMSSRERDKELVETFRARYHSRELGNDDPVVKKVYQRVSYWCRSYKCELNAPEITDHVLDQLVRCTSFGTKETQGSAPLRSFIDTTTKRRIWRKYKNSLQTEPIDPIANVLSIEKKVVERMEDEVFMKELLDRMPPLRKLILFTVCELHDEDPPSKREVVNRIFDRTSTCAADDRCTLRCFDGEKKACYFLDALKLQKKVTRYRIGTEYDQTMSVCREIARSNVQRP